MRRPGYNRWVRLTGGWSGQTGSPPSSASAAPGLEEHVLHFNQSGNAWTADFTPRSSGEVFLYVNEAVVGLPWLYDLFYKNNGGTAEVKLELEPDQKP